MTIANSLAGLKCDTVAVWKWFKENTTQLKVDKSGTWDWSRTVVCISYMADVCSAVQPNEI